MGTAVDLGPRNGRLRIGGLGLIVLRCSLRGRSPQAVRRGPNRIGRVAGRLASCQGAREGIGIEPGRGRRIAGFHLVDGLVERPAFLLDFRIRQGRIEGAQLGDQGRAGALVDGAPHLGRLIGQAFDGSCNEGVIICHFVPA
jgi:hypothetical protein